MNWLVWLAVAGGGAIGATMRYGVTLAATRAFGPVFPAGTLITNLVGCFLMGLLIPWLAGREPNPMALRAFLAVGVLGGFTTFSTFALDVVTLWRDKAFDQAVLYFLASVVLSVAGLIGGLMLGRALS